MRIEAVRVKQNIHATMHQIKSNCTSKHVSAKNINVFTTRIQLDTYMIVTFKLFQ